MNIAPSLQGALVEEEKKPNERKPDTGGQDFFDEQYGIGTVLAELMDEAGSLKNLANVGPTTKLHVQDEQPHSSQVASKWEVDYQARKQQEEAVAREQEEQNAGAERERRVKEKKQYLKQQTLPPRILVLYLLGIVGATINLTIMMIILIRRHQVISTADLIFKTQVLLAERETGLAGLSFAILKLDQLKWGSDKQQGGIVDQDVEAFKNLTRDSLEVIEALQTRCETKVLELSQRPGFKHYMIEKDFTYIDSFGQVAVQKFSIGESVAAVLNSVQQIFSSTSELSFASEDKFNSASPKTVSETEQNYFFITRNLFPNYRSMFDIERTEYWHNFDRMIKSEITTGVILYIASAIIFCVIVIFCVKTILDIQKYMVLVLKIFSFLQPHELEEFIKGCHRYIDTEEKLFHGTADVQLSDSEYSDSSEELEYSEEIFISADNLSPNGSKISADGLQVQNFSQAVKKKSSQLVKPKLSKKVAILQGAERFGLELQKLALENSDFKTPKANYHAIAKISDNKRASISVKVGEKKSAVFKGKVFEKGRSAKSGNYAQANKKDDDAKDAARDTDSERAEKMVNSYHKAYLAEVVNRVAATFILVFPLSLYMLLRYFEFTAWKSAVQVHLSTLTSLQSNLSYMTYSTLLTAAFGKSQSLSPTEPDAADYFRVSCRSLTASLQTELPPSYSGTRMDAYWMGWREAFEKQACSGLGLEALQIAGGANRKECMADERIARGLLVTVYLAVQSSRTVTNNVLSSTSTTKQNSASLAPFVTQTLTELGKLNP